MQKRGNSDTSYNGNFRIGNFTKQNHCSYRYFCSLSLAMLVLQQNQMSYNFKFLLNSLAALIQELPRGTLLPCITENSTLMSLNQIVPTCKEMEPLEFAKRDQSSNIAIFLKYSVLSKSPLTDLQLLCRIVFLFLENSIALLPPTTYPMMFTFCFDRIVCCSMLIFILDNLKTLHFLPLMLYLI